MKKLLILPVLCALFFSTACHAHRAPVVHAPVVGKPVVHKTVVHKTVVHKPVVHKPVSTAPVRVHAPVLLNTAIKQPILVVLDPIEVRPRDNRKHKLMVGESKPRMHNNH